MPEPTTQMLRTKVGYHADDGDYYELKVPAQWATSGIGPSLVPLTQQQIGTLPLFPSNWKARHIWAETTDGEDADGNAHVYRRKFVVNEEDIGPGATLAPGAAFIYAGCNWQVRGRVGEKHRDG